MTQQELYEWLETCPTHLWDDLATFDDGWVRISFPIQEEEVSDER